MLFSEYYKKVSEYIGDVKLVFEFDKDVSGLSYYLNQKGVLSKYLQSPEIVRDRELLRNNPTWLEHHSDFNKKIIVGNGNFWFYCHESVWSPSIDAAFLIDVLLKKERVDKLNIESVLDFGCGTGVMGISVACLNNKIKKLNLIDSNESALFSTYVNLLGNKVNCNFNISNNLDSTNKFDLGIITPYYFPVIKELEENPEKAIIDAGVDSANLTNLVASSSKLTYFIYSSTTEKSYLTNLKFEFEFVDELLVPFTLGDNVSNQSFLDTALDKNMLFVKDKGQFKYWHKITIGRIKN
jgi:hypothetical protein